MQWCEVERVQIKGSIICIKDAMTMLSEDEHSADTPHVSCSPGEYIFEIFTEPDSFYASKARMRQAKSSPEPGKKIGSVEVDHGFIGVIDYETFLNEVQSSYEEYEEWTSMDLDDELAVNFSGQIAFKNAAVSYVKAGGGDGCYHCYELIYNGSIVGIECIFEK